MKPFALLGLTVIVLLVAVAAVLRATNLVGPSSHQELMGYTCLFAGVLLALAGTVGAGFSANRET